MTLHSVFTGEGFQASPGQFFQMMQRWIYENRSSDLMAYFEELQGQSTSDQAEMLIDWMDENATGGRSTAAFNSFWTKSGNLTNRTSAQMMITTNPLISPNTRWTCL